MTDIDPKNTTAALIYIDNSNSSIDGDCKPTRISAQRDTISQFCEFFRRGNPQSVFGCGGMADKDFGLKVSFANSVKNVQLQSIKPGGKILLERAIRSGILAMNQRPKDIKNQVLIFLVGSQHDLTDEKAEEIAHIAHGKGICINIFTFGDEEIDEEPLKHLIEKMNDSSHYNRIPNGTYNLSTSVINQYCSNFNTSMPQSSLDRYNFSEEDSQLQRALQASMLEENDPEILRAIEASKQEMNQGQGGDDEEMDPELRLAYELSQQPLDEEPEKKEEGIQGEIDKLMNDPDQLNNIFNEFDQQNKDDKDKKDDKNKKDDKDKDDKDKKDQNK